MPVINAETDDISSFLRGVHEAEVTYESTAALVDQCIKRGTLSEDYRLTSLTKEQYGEIYALSSLYQMFEEGNREPRILFVPTDLEPEQWDTMFKALKVRGDMVSSGISPTNWDQYPINDPVIGPARPKRNPSSNQSPWRIALISGTETPVIQGLDALGRDSSRGRWLINLANRKPKEITELERRFNLSPGNEPIKTISFVSPSIDTYLALQWTLLFRGRTPVDSRGSTTMLEQNSGHGSKLHGRWDPQERKLKISGMGFRYIGGIRETVQTSDLGLIKPELIIAKS